MAKETQNSKQSSTPVEELSYEEAYEELNQIVVKLEAEELTLEQTISLFERGQNLAQYCTDILDKTEMRIQQITGEQVIDFDSPDI
jgi:exodeoxyribonuclease VII small subunit